MFERKPRLPHRAIQARRIPKFGVAALPVRTAIRDSRHDPLELAPLERSIGGASRVHATETRPRVCEPSGKAPLRSTMSPPQIHRGGARRSGVTPVRVAINAHTFGTYIRVSAGSASAIAVNVVARFAASVRLTRPSPAL